MRFSAVLPAMAAAGLCVSGTASAAGHMLLLPMCLGGSHSAPLPGNDQNGPSKSAGGCHAVCCRPRERCDGDEREGNI